MKVLSRASPSSWRTSFLIQGADAQVAYLLAVGLLARSSEPRCPNRPFDLRHYLYDNGSVALTLLVAVRPLRGLHQAAITKMSNSLFTKRTSSLTCGLHVRQCPRRIIRITSNPFIVAAAVFIV